MPLRKVEIGEQIAQIFAHVNTRDVTEVYFSEPFTRRIQPIYPSRKTYKVYCSSTPPHNSSCSDCLLVQGKSCKHSQHVYTKFNGPTRCHKYLRTLGLLLNIWGDLYCMVCLSLIDLQHTFGHSKIIILAPSLLEDGWMYMYSLHSPMSRPWLPAGISKHSAMYFRNKPLVSTLRNVC